MRGFVMVTSMVVCLLWFVLGKSVEGTKARVEHDLRAKLHASYDDIQRTMVPRLDTEDTLDVSLGISLLQILDFDEDTGAISVLAWDRMAWTDSFLKWDPNEYGEISSLRMPGDLMWRPDLLLYNSMTVGSDENDKVQAAVSYDGGLLYIPPAIHKVICQRVTTSDTRWGCPFRFGSWVYDGYTVDLSLFGDENHVDLDEFQEHETYEVVSTHAQKDVFVYACCEEPYPSLTFTVDIERRG